MRDFHFMHFNAELSETGTATFLSLLDVFGDGDADLCFCAGVAEF